MMKASEIDNFDELLADADTNAKTEWEMAFVAGIVDRHDQYDDDCIVRPAELDILERIAWH